MQKYRAKNWGQHICVVLSSIIILFPVYWIVISSFKTKDEILTYPPKLFPEHLTIRNYITAFQEYNISIYLKNSLVITIFTVLLSILIAVLTAYAMTFLKFSLAKVFSGAIYVLQVLPTITMLVPLMTIYRKLGIQNSYLSLIITYTASVSGVPIALLLLLGYFEGIPSDLFESAEIDGASTMTILRKVVLPLAMPGIVCTGIYVFIQAWQEFMFAVNLVTTPEMYTLPVGLQSFVGQRSTDWGGMMATCTMIAVPAIILFTSVQKYFIDNLAGAVKE